MADQRTERAADKVCAPITCAAGMRFRPSDWIVAASSNWTDALRRSADAASTGRYLAIARRWRCASRIIEKIARYCSSSALTYRSSAPLIFAAAAS